MTLDTDITRLACSLVLAAFVASCAKGIEPESDDVFIDGRFVCPKPAGLYDAVYVMRTGTCSANAPSAAPRVFIKKMDTLSAATEMFETHDVVTASWVSDCDVRIRQDVVDRRGFLQMIIEAETTSMTDGILTGIAEVTLYDANEQPSCTADYDLDLTPVALTK